MRKQVDVGNKMKKLDKLSRVLIASEINIDKLDALIALQPVPKQDKKQTREQWRAEQIKILSHHPQKPRHYNDREREE